MTQNPKKNFFKETLKRHSLLFVFIGLSFTPRLFSQSPFTKHIKPEQSSSQTTVISTTASNDVSKPAQAMTAEAVVAPRPAAAMDQHPAAAAVDRKAPGVSTPAPKVEIAIVAKRNVKDSLPAKTVKETVKTEEVQPAKDSVESTIISVRPVSDVPFPEEPPIAVAKSDSLTNNPSK